ncbi:hypothetical protein [Staphylococcus simulans]|uniref:hypothetical protein n=1 Tax=Staphylococcus simulans TaxID=1286 RepID=UPI000D025E10|nr:hypothetical protein [Staphylococcus simulans]
MYETVLEITTEDLSKIIMNMGDYTSIYNENSTHEEHILSTLKDFFQPRNSNKDQVVITDLQAYEKLSSNRFRGYILNHSMVEGEHQLAASSMMNKKIVRELTNNLEIEGYINSINVLLDDLRENLKGELPLAVKPFDLKQFVKLLSFKYDYSTDYSRLISRLEQVVPLIVDEMNYQAKNKAFLVYLYPESGLSIKEQLRFRKLLDELPLPVIVLTESQYFLSDHLNGLNYFISNIQMITADFFDDLYWNAPINVEKVILKERFMNLFVNYCSFLEVNPTISNHNLSEIIVFDDIDLYVIVAFLKHCKLEYQLDIDKSAISKALVSYLFA